MEELVNDHIITKCRRLTKKVNIKREAPARRAASPLPRHVADVNLLRLYPDLRRPAKDVCLEDIDRDSLLELGEAAHMVGASVLLDGPANGEASFPDRRLRE
jgi:hypothetical protein